MSIRFQHESALASRQYVLKLPGICNVKAVRTHCGPCLDQRTVRKPISGVHRPRSQTFSQPQSCSPQAYPAANKLLHQSDSHQSLQVAVAGQAWAEATGLLSQHTQCQLPSLKRWADQCRSIAAVCVSCIVLLLTSPADFAEARTRLTQDELSITELFRENTPSVVFITNMASRRDAYTLDMLEIPQGAGSGLIWDMSGHIVTNYHVIRGASELQVTLTGGAEHPAKIVGFDEDRDVAVLQLIIEDGDLPSLHPTKLGDSAGLLVGQKVFAIGNPFGLDHTLTSGIISGTGREISSGNTGRPIQDVIQTDAAINPGNSGGPLLDSDGSLIGINTAIYSPSGANSGVGFAIPVDIVRSSVDQIIRFGRVIRPILGISFAPDQSSEQLGVQGILVLDARKGGPAWKSGIKGTSRDKYGRLVLGDIITAMNSKRVRTASDLYKLLDKCSIGDVIDMEVLRENNKEHVAITLESSSSLPAPQMQPEPVKDKSK
ncbi:TPA: Protease Do-like 1, chloroplastic [Trebouxia sp. C0006]